MAGALRSVAGNRQQAQLHTAKSGRKQQRLEANTKQQSFYFQSAVMQQFLGKGPCKNSLSLL